MKGHLQVQPGRIMIDIADVIKYISSTKYKNDHTVETFKLGLIAELERIKSLALEMEYENV